MAAPQQQQQQQATAASRAPAPAAAAASRGHQASPWVRRPGDAAATPSAAANAPASGAGGDELDFLGGM